MKHFAILSMVLGAFSAAAETLVIQNVTLIDGTGRKPVARANVIVENGRITQAGRGGRIPKDAERVDGTGKFLMPGIMNLHGHVGNVKGLVQDPKFFTRENLNAQLRTYAEYGVTGVATMGSETDLIFSVRDEQRAGRPSLTRIYTAYRGFTGKNGYPTKAAGMHGVPFEVENAAQVEKAVEELAQRKVDLVKIWVDDHLGKEQKISMEMCKAIIENAKKHGLRVAAHIFYMEDARQLSEMGLYAIIHSVRDKDVTQDFIQTMKRNGTWQGAATLTREISTFVYAQDHPFLSDPFFLKSVDPAVVATIKSDDYRKRMRADPDLSLYPEFLKTAQRNLKRLVDGGVKYGFGTDSGPPARFSGYFEHWEMELMVKSGLTPDQVIQGATKNAAEYLGVQRDLGTLEKGKWADMVLLDADPLADIMNTRKIAGVWIAGNKVR